MGHLFKRELENVITHVIAFVLPVFVEEANDEDVHGQGATAMIVVIVSSC